MFTQDQTAFAIDGDASRFPSRGDQGRTASNLVLRYANLTRAAIHIEARRRRFFFAEKVLAGTFPEVSSLPAEMQEYVHLLDIPEPISSLTRSLKITDRAIDEMPMADLTPVQLAGLASALVERELWELPTKLGTMTTNVTLSKIAGNYFTPPNIAWYIAAKTIQPIFEVALNIGDTHSLIRASKIKILDPACGAGVFLLAALELFLDFYDRAVTVCPVLLTHFGTRREFARTIARSQLFGADKSSRLTGITKRLLSAWTGIEQHDVSGIYRGDSLRGAFDSQGTLPRPAGNEFGDEISIDWTTTGIAEGADVVLLNPPFGRLRVLESQFQERSRALRTDNRTKRRIHVQRRSYFERLGDYFRQNPDYLPALGGVLDWQRLFLVRSINLLSECGRLGAIVPVSILGDKSAATFRKHLLAQTSLERIDRLLETAKLFPGVNQPTCILIAQKGRASTQFITSKPVATVPIKKRNEFKVHVSTLKKLTGEDLGIPATDLHGWRILDNLHKNVSLGDMPQICNLRGELDLTNFREHIGKGTTRLIRGDHIERFQLRGSKDSSREGLVNKGTFLKSIKGSPKSKHILRPRLVGRQCAFLEKPRRLSFALIEQGSIVANSCNYILWEGSHETKGLLFLSGILCSLLAEWRVGLTSSNNHINNYELDAMPIALVDPQPVIDAAQGLIRHYQRRPFGESAFGTGEIEDRLDCAVFRSYGLHRKDVEKIVSEVAPNRLAALMNSYSV